MPSGRENVVRLLNSLLLRAAEVCIDGRFQRLKSGSANNKFYDTKNDRI